MHKNLLSFIFLLFLTWPGLSSCSSDDTAPTPELTMSLEALSFPSAGETKVFHVKSNIDWTVTSSESWCSVSTTNGNAGTIKVDVTAAPNPNATTRTANITITAGTLSETVAVTQAAAVILTLSENSFEVDPNGEEIVITIQSSGEYQVTSDTEWITAATGSTASERKFTISPNRSLFERSANITFSLNSIVQTVVVDQNGQPLNITADETGVNNNAMALAQKIKVGWNLGNSLEATSNNNGVYTASETLWGNPRTSQTLIDAVKAAGFNAIRIPCGWSGYIEDTDTHRIKDSWLARVKEVIDYCVNNDMYVIINIHWDGGWLEEHPLYANQEEVNKKQKALWEQIAVYFRDYDEHLLFAGTNEVHADYNTPTPEHIAVQLSYNQTFVDAVRSTGGKNTWRNLVVQAYNTNISFARDYMIMPTDAEGVNDRLMAEVHFYDPYDFTLDATSSHYLWGSEFTGNDNVSDWGQEAWVDDIFEVVKTKFVDHNIPVILGEYAATLRSNLGPAAYANHIKSRNHYLNYVNRKAKDNGMIPFYWDNGVTGNNGSGLFDRATGEQIHGDAVTAIISAFD